MYLYQAMFNQWTNEQDKCASHFKYITHVKFHSNCIRNVEEVCFQTCNTVNDQTLHGQEKTSCTSINHVHSICVVSIYLEKKGKVPRKHSLHGINSRLGFIEAVHQQSRMMPHHWNSIFKFKQQTSHQSHKFTTLLQCS